MSVKAQVNDSSGNPVKGEEVQFWWYSGVQIVRTNDYGVADTKVSNPGTLNKVTIRGYQVLGKQKPSSNEFYELDMP